MLFSLVCLFLWLVVHKWRHTLTHKCWNFLNLWRHLWMTFRKFLSCFLSFVSSYQRNNYLQTQSSFFDSRGTGKKFDHTKFEITKFDLTASDRYQISISVISNLIVNAGNAHSFIKVNIMLPSTSQKAGLTGLYKKFLFMSTTAISKPVLQEVEGIVILPLTFIKEWALSGKCCEVCDQK